MSGLSTRLNETDCPKAVLFLLGNGIRGEEGTGAVTRPPPTHILALTLECSPLHSPFQLEGVLYVSGLPKFCPLISCTSNLRLGASSDQDQVLGDAVLSKGG